MLPRKFLLTPSNTSAMTLISGFPGVCECTTRRDDARNSTSSQSNVDDAPPL
uniref:Uncharacterized protein n=1 Tax=Triticum urartu TaxID=4572 RepID=A0A8R7Q982_TRIUA